MSNLHPPYAAAASTPNHAFGAAAAGTAAASAPAAAAPAAASLAPKPPAVRPLNHVNLPTTLNPERLGDTLCAWLNVHGALVQYNGTNTTASRFV